MKIIDKHATKSYYKGKVTKKVDKLEVGEEKLRHKSYLVKQYDMTDCAAECLATVCMYY